MTFKEKERIIKNYATEYNKSKIIEIKGIELLNERIRKDEINKYIDNENKYTYYYALQTRIDMILENLDYEMSYFLKREFFTAKKSNIWWEGYYSRSTYYRLKNKCMDSFLGMIYA